MLDSINYAMENPGSKKNKSELSEDEGKKKEELPAFRHINMGNGHGN